MTASTVLTGRCPGTPVGANRVHLPYLGTQSRSRTTTS